MLLNHDACRRHVALVAVCSLLVSPMTPLLQAQAPAKSPAAATAAPAPADRGWPRAYTTPSGGQIVIYQPQIASWEQQARMVGYAAVSYLATGATKPALGSVKLETNTQVALSDRLVRFSTFEITEASFPSLAKEHVREVVAEIGKAIPDEERVIGLDRVLAGVDKSQIMPKNVEGVKADPPTIFFSERPAVLVNIDGEPIWSPITDNDLKFAVNTNWDLFQHATTKLFYLRHNQGWLQAADLKGPWQPAGALPDSFKKLPAEENWKEVRAAVPGKAIPSKQAPTVYVSQAPAELILLTGKPSYITVGTTKLLWVNNTDSDLFRLGRTGPVYYLVAGRWFSAPDFTGPWTFATPSLPAEFTRIPLEHDRSRVLASVPGTQQAAEAVLLAQVPQTARVNKKELKAPEVAYQGEPKFDPIPSTSVARAVNTDKDIIKAGDLYYMCFQGVWFVSKTATGPWEVASTIPQAIYQIPASSPSHNVTYVVVEDSSDDWVTFAAVAGYTGIMVAYGCAVWGTGYYYPPYVGWVGYYPHYYPYYPTYGYAAHYNPWTGAYGRTAVAYGPYGGAGVTARYNPTTGTYARGAAAWGPYGARGAAQAYNPRTGTYAQTRQGSGVYGSWGSTAVQRGDDWAQTSRVTNNRTGTTTRVTRGDEGGAAVTRRGPGGTSGVARTESGDIYAGKDGNVYRKEGDSWQKYENGTWSSPDRVQPTAEQRSQATDRVNQLNRDASARTSGNQRTRDYSNYRSGGASTRSGGSYRPRGGGGRRR